MAEHATRRPGDTGELGSEPADDAGLAGIAGLLRRLAGNLRPHRARVLLVLLTLVPEVAIETVQPLLLAALIDNAIIPGDTQLVVTIVTALLGLLLLYTASEVVRSWATVAVGGRVTNDIRLALFRRLQDLPISFYDRQQGGQILGRFSSDMDAVEDVLVVQLPYAVSCLATIVVGSLFMLLLEWRLAVPLLLLLPLVVLGPRFLGRAVNRASYRRQADVARMLGTVEEVTAAQPVVKAFGLAQPVMDRFDADLARLLRSTKRAGWLAGLQAGAMTASGRILLTAALGLGAFMAVDGLISIGVLVAMFELLWFVMGSVSELGAILPPLQRAAAGMSRIQEVLDAPPDLQDAPGALALPPFTGEIRFEGVTFRYPDTATDQLSDVSLSIPAGRWVSVVGGSGSGKTTLLGLLMRFHDPSAGRVTVDDHDLRDVTQVSLRGQMGIVFQEPFLFDASIADNIGLGRPGATEEDIEHAAVAADIHASIAALPGGYDAMVGDRGRHLSGGQRQRVSLARALVRRPRILVLDEAASALDARAEAAINGTLRALAGERTIISVTHRLRSAAQADLIIVLQEGRVVDQGMHRELVARPGVYRDLWNQQEQEQEA